MDMPNLAPEVHAAVERTFAALQERGYAPLFVPDRKAAFATVLGLIPKGAAVAHGSSTTLIEIGLEEYLARPDSGYRYLNAEWKAENDAAKRQGLRATLSAAAGYYLGSVQALCETGESIGADMTGSRQAFYVFGPPHVIWVVGINKLVPTREDGMRRLWEVAVPQEDARMKRLGAKGTAVGKIVCYERDNPPGRTTVVVVGESLGY
jgi:hypothetical protein